MTAARPKNHEWLALTVEAPLEPELTDLRSAPSPVGPARPPASSRATSSTRSWSDTRAGHNIVSTVFIECGAMFKPDGPEALRPVGETEFVNGIAAMSASGIYGTTRVAAGIVGTADLRLGAAVGTRARRADRGRRRPLPRHPPARGVGRRPGRAATTAPDPAPGLFAQDDFRAGFALLAPRRLTFEAWVLSPPDPRRHRAGAASSPTPRSS